MRITHAWTDDEATIRIEGLSREVRVLHVTDSHLSQIDERDAEHVDACSDFRERFGSRRQDEDGNNIFAEVTFEETMVGAAGQNLDLVAHTGDLIHFPSKANLESAAQSLAKSQTDFIYTAGNHDWHFPGTENVDGLRETVWPALESLHRGHPSHCARDAGGIRFLAVDDSNYQIREEQLAFVRESLAAGLPTVLLIHIPLSLATLRDRTIERWKAPILLGDPDWNMESRDRWHAGEDTSATLDFVRTVSTAPNLAAVLCGHIHFPHADAVSPRAVQYVTAPGYAGGRRLITFAPLA